MGAVIRALDVLFSALGLVVGAPLLLLCWSTARLAVCFQFEERFQAAASAAAAAAFLGAVGIVLARPMISFSALFVTAAALRLVYVHALLPERDLLTSPRADASAVARAMPPNSTLFTNLPTSDRFRYYVGVEVLPLAKSEGAVRRGVACCVLASAAEADRLPGRWAKIREIGRAHV